MNFNWIFGTPEPEQYPCGQCYGTGRQPSENPLWTEQRCEVCKGSGWVQA